MTKVVYKDNVPKYLQKVQSNMKSAAQDIKNDWQNTSRSMSPIKSGQLVKGITGKVTSNGSGFKIEIDARAMSGGQPAYNYAEKMHNASYALGKQSISKGYGESGISGKSYKVGNGYISKPLAGNFKSYRDHIQSALTKSEV